MSLQLILDPHKRLWSKFQLSPYSKPKATTTTIMAAVLCSGIGELLKASCDAIGKVVTFPCKACGCACHTFGDVITSPFFPYLALTFALNMPGVVYGFMSLAANCSVVNWMISNGVLSLIHMAAALYIVHKIRETPAPLETPIKTGDVEEQPVNYSNFTIPKRNEHGAANSFSRIKHVLCYDKTMAVYIMIFIGWIILLADGVAKRLNANGNDCEPVLKWMSVVISFGYMYLSMVFVAFGCSLCCLR